MTALAVKPADVRAALNETGDWLWGVIAGNFDDRPQSTSQIVVAGVISMVPGIDQIMDVRDLIASLFKMSHEDGRTDDNMIEFAFTLIGLVPTVGSAGRMGLRLVADGKSLKTGMAQLNAANYGNALHWFEKANVNTFKQPAFAACGHALDLLDKVAADLKKHNKGLTGVFIPDELVVKAEAVARTARKTWGEIQGSVDKAFSQIQAKLDEAVKTYKKDKHTAASQNTNTSAKPQREHSKKTKGLACEGKATAYMIMMGYNLISVDLDIPQGLDGVFEHDGENPGRTVTAPVVFDPVSSKPPPYPKYVVLEAKYDGKSNSTKKSQKGKLRKTQTGRQGSKEYAEGERLDQAVGSREKAKEIRRTQIPGMSRRGPSSWLFVCLVGAVVMFIDVSKKWPDLYNSTDNKLKKAPSSEKKIRKR